MDDSMREIQGKDWLVNIGRLFKVVKPTENDLRLAAEIPADACPRRYCWWWTSLGFEWELAPIEGCTFLKTRRPSHWKFANVPCCRSDPSSHVDHFEPRGPHIEEDRIDASRWLKYRFENDKEGLLHLKQILESEDAESLRYLALALLHLPPTTPFGDWRNAMLEWIGERLHLTG
jgi:hypothetical protein